MPSNIVDATDAHFQTPALCQGSSAPLAGIKPATIEILKQGAKVRKYKPGEHVFDQGDASDPDKRPLSIILSGEFKLHHIMYGELQHFATDKTPTILSDVEYFMRDVDTAALNLGANNGMFSTVVCSGGGTALEIPMASVTAACQQDMQLMLNLGRGIAVRLLRTNEKMDLDDAPRFYRGLYNLAGVITKHGIRRIEPRDTEHGRINVELTVPYERGSLAKEAFLSKQYVYKLIERMQGLWPGLLDTRHFPDLRGFRSGKLDLQI